MMAYQELNVALNEPLQIKCACGGRYEVAEEADPASGIQSQVAPDRRWTCTGCYHNIYTGRFWGKVK